MGACAAAIHPGKAEKLARKESIVTRGQLLLAVNAWLKKHHQPEWTVDELVGRIVDESFAYKSFGPLLDRPVDSFAVALIKNRRFDHQIELHTDWTDELQLSSSHRVPLPSHHTLSIRILATSAELYSPERKPHNGSHWGILVASALPAKQPKEIKTTKENDVNTAEIYTPRQLLSAVNTVRRSQHQPGLTRDELCMRLADAALAHYRFEKNFPEYVAAFLKRFIQNRRFENSIDLQNYWTDSIELADRGKMAVPGHDSLYVDIPNMPRGSLDANGNHLFVSTTQFVVSFSFRP